MKFYFDKFCDYDIFTMADREMSWRTPRFPARGSPLVPPVLTGSLHRLPPAPPNPPDPVSTTNFPPLSSSQTIPPLFSSSISSSLIPKETTVVTPNSTISASTTPSVAQLLASYHSLPPKASENTIFPVENSRSEFATVMNPTTLPNPSTVTKQTYPHSCPLLPTAPSPVLSPLTPKPTPNPSLLFLGYLAPSLIWQVIPMPQNALFLLVLGM